MFEQPVVIVNILSSEVKRRMANGEKLQMIDVREPKELLAGKIPGVKNIRLSEIPYRWSEIDKNREAIIVCRSGSRSASACEYLMLQGFTNVKNLLGGMNGWDGDIE